MKLKLHQHTIDYLYHNTLQNKIKTTVPMHFNSEMQIKNVSYEYDQKQKLIDDVSFVIKKGEIFGISGISGSGKSTLMKMISGLILPQKGEISIDGVALNTKNIQSWQNQIGFVHQNPFIFNKTLHENISLNSTYDAAKMERAILHSGLQRFLEHLPNGLDTLLGEQGSRISEGQKQRIAIARALYKESSVLLFDEATSSLDSETEDIVIESLQNLKKQNVTLVIIAHKKRIIDLCDHTYHINQEDLEKQVNESTY
jgi:ABC-type bacteriocin/lantibiotic exporter with double-glycine peptidase domain